MATRFALLGMLCLGLATGSLAAQDSIDATPRATRLRQMIEDRFADRVQQELGLTDQQTGRMREVVLGYFGKRRALEGEERRLKQALAGELRPGVAARKDVATRLTDQLLDVKVRYAQSYKDEARELGGFLDPVQLAQYVMLRERLLDGIRQAQELRDDSGGGLPRRRLRP